jgi:hypothetical protein
MTAMIWVHADALSRDHPVFAVAPSGARAIYIWDAEDLARRDWSLKRCVFVLECLAEMGVEIVTGRTTDVLAAVSAENIFTAATPDPDRLSAISELGDKITVVSGPRFATVPAGADMGRFFRYWNKAKRDALKHTSPRSAAKG